MRSNRVNRERRAEAVERLRRERGVGERFVDVFHGDDSDDLVRRVDQVLVPIAQTRYSATGGLEWF